MHTRKDSIAFYADLEFLPFPNENNETELILVFIKDVTDFPNGKALAFRLGMKVRSDN